MIKSKSSGGVMQPIRDKEKIKEIINWLLVKKGMKYSFMFTFGMNTGLRISDILRLKVEDVENKKVLYLTMKKTKRQVNVYLNPFIQQEISEYIKFKKDGDYLFPSREGVNKPLTRQTVSAVMREVAVFFDLEKFNTHTMRKSYGYWYYKENKDVYFLMKLFGHNTQMQTLDYIGIEADEIADSLKNFSLGD